MNDMKNRELTTLLVIGFVALFSLIGFSGCINLKPVPDTIQQYLLGGELTEPSATSGEKGLYIMRPNLPEYLRSQNFVYTRGDGELLTVPHARWAEPLEIGIARKLAQSLLAQEGVGAAGMYPWPVPGDADRLKIDIYRLNARADGSFEVSIYWEVVSADSEMRYGSYESQSFSWDGATAESYLSGMNQVLVGLLKDILSQVYE